MRKPSAAAGLGVALLALALSACGGSGDSTTAGSTTTGSTPTVNVNVKNDHLSDGLTGAKLGAAAAVQAYLVGREEGDAEAICGLTSKTDAALKTCKEQLGHLPPSNLHKYSIVSEQLNGNNATLILKPEEGKKNVLFKMRKVSGDWKVIVFTFQPSTNG